MEIRVTWYRYSRHGNPCGTDIVGHVLKEVFGTEYVFYNMCDLYSELWRDRYVTISITVE